jgi:urease accessory protein
MPSTMTASRAHGRLRLRFTQDAEGRTRLTDRAQEPPLQVVRAFDLPDGASLVHLHNVSGGVLGGDHLETVVEVGPGAQAQLTTTGATRVYRPRASDQTAVQATTVQVGAGGLLEWLPDPLIPFAGARFRQEARITLASGAGLFWWETVAPGRVAHGEVFAYHCLEIALDVWAEGRFIARERTRLEPSPRPLTSPARLGLYRHFCTFYICRIGEPSARWTTLEAELSVMAQELSVPGDCLWGVSALPAHGLSVRGLSRTGRDLPPRLLLFWQAAKRALYGRAALPPRKVY